MKVTCSSCAHCKTRVFRTIPGFLEWLDSKTDQSAGKVPVRIRDKGCARVYWCARPLNPKIYLSITKNFPDANQFCFERMGSDENLEADS